MNEKKFIRILSPITIAVVMLLDAFTVGYSIYSINKVIESLNAISICFAVMMLIVVVVACFVTKEVFSNGVMFKETEVEFIGLDKDNLFSYQDIEKIEFQRDDKASFKKNFNDRHSILIFHLNDERVATIDLGLTTKKTLIKIVDELKNRTK